MKKLIYIDNDDANISNRDVARAQQNLNLTAKIPADKLSEIEVIPDLYKMDHDKMLNLLFDPQNCIITWSMYTANNYGSLQQLFSFLSSAGRNDIKDKIYIDTGSYLLHTLERHINDGKMNVLNILNAIETNYIISCCTKETYRIRVNLSGMRSKHFRKEEIDLIKLLEI